MGSSIESGSDVQSVPFTDIVGQYRETRDEILAAWADILDAGRFVSGAEVRHFEETFAEANGSDHCVAVSSGTDALTLALQALGVGSGDAVAVPTNSFVATAEAVCNAGARPVLIDCERSSALMDAQALAAVQDPELRGAIPVHLYGAPAPMPALTAALPGSARWMLEDAAQSHLATLDGRKTGTMGLAGCFSFYPGKNMGAPGEGGAIITDDEAIADTVRELRDHGQVAKYHSRHIGWNARMSEIIAVALRLRLPLLPGWTAARRQAANWYRERLEGIAGLTLQDVSPDGESAYHLFVVTVSNRDRIADELKGAGISTGLHYPVPIHRQPAFSFLGHIQGDFPNAEWRADRLLSLPIYPGLSERQVERVCDVLGAAIESHRDE